MLIKLRQSLLSCTAGPIVGFTTTTSTTTATSYFSTTNATPSNNPTSSKDELGYPRAKALTKMFSFEEHQDHLMELFLSWKPLMAVEYYKTNILYSPPYKNNSTLQHLMINNLFTSGHDKIAQALMGPSMHLRMKQCLLFEHQEKLSHLLPLLNDPSTMSLVVVDHIKNGRFVEGKEYLLNQILSSHPLCTIPPHAFDDIFKALFDKHQMKTIDELLMKLKASVSPAVYVPSQALLITLTSGFAKKNLPQKVASVMEWMKELAIKPSKRLHDGITFAYSHLMDGDQLNSFLEEIDNDKSTTSTIGATISSLMGRHEYKKAMDSLIKLRSLEEDGSVYEGLAVLFKKLKASSLLTLLEGIVLKDAVSVDDMVDANGCTDCTDNNNTDNNNNNNKNNNNINNNNNNRNIIPSPTFMNIVIENNLDNLNYSRVDCLLKKIVLDWGMSLDASYLRTITAYFANNGNFLALDRIHSLLDKQSLAMVGIDPFMKVFFPSMDDQIFKVNWIDVAALKRDSVNDFRRSNSSSKALSLLHRRPSKYISVKNRVDISFALDSNSGVKDQFEFLFPRLEFRPTISSSNWILFKLLFIEDTSSMMKCWELIKATPSVKPDSLTFLNLIKGCIVVGDIKMAQLLIVEMGKYSLTPSPFCCALVLHEFCRLLMTDEAEDFLRMIHDLYQISFNHIFFASLIFAYTRKKEYSSVFTTFDRLEKRNQRPDSESCNYILVSLLELGESDEAMRFIKMMDANGIARNVYTYNYVADSLILSKEYASLLEFLKIDSIKDGNSCSSTPFNRLLSALYSDGLCEDMYSVLMAMVECCCKFSLDTVPFIMKVFSDEFEKVNMIGGLKTIVMKLMVDITNDDNGYIQRMVKGLLGRLEGEDLQEFKDHIARIDDISALWCDTSDTIKRLQTHRTSSISFPSDSNNLFPRESTANTNNEGLTFERERVDTPMVDLNKLYSADLKLNN